MGKDPCIVRLVRMFGGSSSETGRRLGVKRQLVNCWINRGRIPARHAENVEKVTAGEITLREIIAEHAQAAGIDAQASQE